VLYYITVVAFFFRDGLFVRLLNLFEDKKCIIIELDK
jgi:hypothetical protein